LYHNYMERWTYIPLRVKFVKFLMKKWKEIRHAKQVRQSIFTIGKTT
jgi:hypothetical protein